MNLDLSRTKRKVIIGWAGIGMMVLAYAALYLLNYRLPLGLGNYTTRIWAWSQLALTVLAFVVVVQKREQLKPGILLTGLALGGVSALSHWFHNPNVSMSIFEAVSVWICFLGGATLYRDRSELRIPAFQLPPRKIVLSLIVGIALAVPLSAINNLYFYLNSGAVHFQNVLVSAFAALSPAIHEEIIFRFFIFALCFNLLRFNTSPRLRMLIAYILAVMPHSLNHLPDLFLQDPLTGFFMLIVTSLLFGLPMALLQVKKNLETAIAFHWFIDFMRFLFGF